MHFGRLVGPEIGELLRDDPVAARGILEEVHPEDIADLIDELEPAQAQLLLEELPSEDAAQVFQRLEPDQQEALAEKLGPDQMAELVVEMDPDDRADFFSELPPAIGTPILATVEKTDPDVVEEIEELIRWPETSAGGLMTTDFVSVDTTSTIEEAITELKQKAERTEALDTVFVTEDGVLTGALPLRTLLLSRPFALAADVMDKNIISVPASMDQEEVAKTLAKYDLQNLPVVGTLGELLGIVTSDDVLDVLTEEQNEDALKMAAVEPTLERYLDTSFSTFLRMRAPWLLLLFVTGFGTTQALKSYDHVLAAIGSVSIYVPLVIATGGNSGTQSSTLVIRALAVGDISARDWVRVFMREAMLGLCMGLMLAALGVLRVFVGGDGWSLGLVVGATIVANVTIGCLVGAMLPFVLRRLGFDPATSSTPFISTLVDVLGVILYLNVATWVMGDVLSRVLPGR